MANTSKIQGLRPIDQPFGNIRINYYLGLSTLDLYLYQAVSMNDTGVVGNAQIGSDNALLGSLVGVLDGKWKPIKSDQGYYKANDGDADANGYIRLAVADDPDQYFVIEGDTGGSALAATNMGNGADLTYIASGTGNLNSGVSNQVMDRSTASTNSGCQLKLIKLWDKPDNAYGDYAKWVVKIHNHQNSPPGLIGGSELI